MKYPRMSPNSRLRATVPALSGGLNVGTDASLIGDMQVSDCLDMHWRDGALRTRHGFVTDSQHLNKLALDRHMQYFIDPEGYLLTLAIGDTEASTELLITVFDSDGVATGDTFSITGQLGMTAFLVPSVGEGELSRYTALLFVDGEIYGVNAGDNVWERLYEKFYVPLYMINGTPAATWGELSLNGDRVEAYNCLTGGFRCKYTTDGKGIYYALPALSENSGVTVTLEREGGTLTYAVSSGDTESEAHDGYQVHFARRSACFWFTDESGTPIAVNSTGIHNNVTARASHAYINTPSASAMKFGTWYGSDRSAALGGTRLFLGGGCHVMWSAPYNPLYFPVTAYAMVGNPHEPLTAFGKQGELLLLFKTHSLYAAEYVRSDTVTAEEVQSGAVTDVTATAVFPIIPIHDEIGCDLPETVALFGNRLVWACQSGTVYALSTTGQLSQRTVQVLSEPIRPLLRETVPTRAAGAVHDGRYWLLWDNTVFELVDDSERRWSRFSFTPTGAAAQCLCCVEGSLRIPAAYTVGSSTVLFWFRQEGDTDTRITHTGTFWGDAQYTFTALPITGRVRTKQFDFGSPDEYKHITQVFADAVAVGAVRAAYVTEQGVSADLRTPAVSGVRLTPHVTHCRRFALQLAGDGLRVNSVTVQAVTGRR